jgi:hypothetical protein
MKKKTSKPRMGPFGIPMLPDDHPFYSTGPTIRFPSRPPGKPEKQASPSTQTGPRQKTDGAESA